MRFQVTKHFLEVFTAAFLGGFNIHIFLGNHEIIRNRIAVKKLKLSRNGEAFFLLLLGGYACVKDRLGLRLGFFREESLAGHGGVSGIGKSHLNLHPAHDEDNAIRTNHPWFETYSFGGFSASSGAKDTHRSVCRSA